MSVTVTQVVGWITKIPTALFGLLKTIVGMCADFFIHIKTEIVLVPGEADPRQIVKGQQMHLPVNTTSVTVRGSYLLRPAPDADYALFTRRDTRYWPQGHLNILPARRWDATATFGSTGHHHLCVVKMTPEIKALHRYYRDTNQKIDQSRQAIAHILQKLPKDVAEHARPWQPLEHMDKLPAYHVVHEFEVVIGP